MARQVSKHDNLSYLVTFMNHPGDNVAHQVNTNMDK